MTVYVVKNCAADCTVGVYTDLHTAFREVNGAKMDAMRDDLLIVTDKEGDLYEVEIWKAKGE